MKFVYPTDYKVTFDYFRAVKDDKEISERVFWLTTKVIGFLPSFYTGWFDFLKDIINFKGYKEIVYLEIKKRSQRRTEICKINKQKKPQNILSLGT